LARVTALVRGPLSDHEALLMSAITVHGIRRSDLAALTGVAQREVEDALAQLIRRGLIPIREPRSSHSKHQWPPRPRPVHTHPSEPPWPPSAA
jgi:transcription initiation factor IIE alpha subunit